MGMCCEKKTMIWVKKCMEYVVVPGPEVDQRKLEEQLWKKTVRMPWIIVDV